MADDMDEFDVEIENAVFDIEEDDVETEQSSAPAQISSEKAIDKVKVQISPQTLEEQSVQQINVVPGAKGSSAAPDVLPSYEGDKNLKDSFDSMESEMDDGFDDLLSQIDESEISKNFSKMKTEQLLKPKNNDEFQSPFKVPYNNSDPSPRKRSACDETSSFFSSQDNSNGQPPLKRRFPGPAGLLPHLPRDELKFINAPPHPLYQKVAKLIPGNSENNSSLYSRVSKGSMQVSNAKIGGNEKLLSKAPWKSLVKTLNLNPKDGNDLLNNVNIEWVRAKARRFPEETKIPFLAVVVQGELEVATSKKNFRCKNPSVKLMDPSGTIVAAFNQNFVEAFGDKIVPGTALALRNCGILRLKKHIIVTVAKKSLIYLATTKEANQEESTTVNDQDSTNKPLLKIEKEVSVIQTGPFNPQKIREEFNDITIKLNANPLIQNQNDRIPSRNLESEHGRVASLFTVVSSSLGTHTNRTSVVSPASNPCIVGTASPQPQQNHVETENYSNDASCGFDDDDDEDLIQALNIIDFVIDEDSM